MFYFQAWLFAMRESQQCLTLLKKIIKAPEEGFKDLESETQSESDVIEKKEKVKYCDVFFNNI